MKDINEIKTKFIGKTYFFLTVEDIIEVDSSIKLKCLCKCGNSHIISIKKFGVTKSCGCYQKSDEYKQYKKQWNLDHKQELLNKGKRYSQWCKDNPDKLKSRNDNLRLSWDNNKRKCFSDKRKEYYNSHKEEREAISKRVADWWSSLTNDDIRNMASSHKKSKLETRISDINSDFISDLHIDDFNKLMSGELVVGDLVRTKCPICLLYSEHRFNNVYHVNSKEYTPRMCQSCYKKYSTSKYESEIEDFISTFYNESPIRNSRDIIPPLELDLYYPSKRIAIEFNGDYWHNSSKKSPDYHYNKYIACKNLVITLVSIFESYWNSDKHLICNYIRDLFNGIENRLSFNDDLTLMNNNYPSKNYITEDINISDSYKYKNYLIYTCGYSHIL